MALHRSQPYRPVNVWLGNVSLGNRKSCPHCHVKLTDGNSLVQVGEYHHVRWYTAFYACKLCLDTQVKGRLGSQGYVYHTRSGHRIPWLADIPGEKEV